jgi:hypothetical protein
VTPSRPNRIRRAAGAWLRGLLLVAAGVGLALVARWFHAQWMVAYTDGHLVEIAGRHAVLRTVVWEPPSPLRGLPLDGPDQLEPALSADGQTLIFVRGRAKEGADLYMARSDGRGGWSEPAPLYALNTEADEMGPAISQDGELLYFVSDRPGGAGGYDLWVARWDGTFWADPKPLGPEVNSPHHEYDPAPSPDGRRLLFSSNRPREEALPDETAAAWRGTLREIREARDFDLYVAHRLPPPPDDPETTLAAYPDFEPAVAVAELSTPYDEGQPAFTPRGDYVLFSSNRPGGLGGFDLYRARLTEGIIHPPENLGWPVNSIRDDMDPALAMEGHQLIFSTDRGSEVAGEFGLQASITREVYVTGAGSPLRALLATLVRLRGWIAGAVLLVVAMAALLWYLVRGPTTLTQRAVAASVLLHLLIAFLFSLMILSSEVLLSAGRDPAFEIAVSADNLAMERLALAVREDVTRMPEMKTLPAEAVRTEFTPLPEVTADAPLAAPSTPPTAVDLAFATRSVPPVPRPVEAPAPPPEPPRPPAELPDRARPDLPRLEMAAAATALAPESEPTVADVESAPRTVADPVPPAPAARDTPVPEPAPTTPTAGVAVSRPVPEMPPVSTASPPRPDVAPPPVPPVSASVAPAMELAVRVAPAAAAGAQPDLPAPEAVRRSEVVARLPAPGAPPDAPEAPDAPVPAEIALARESDPHPLPAVPLIAPPLPPAPSDRLIPAGVAPSAPAVALDGRTLPDATAPAEPELTATLASDRVQTQDPPALSAPAAETAAAPERLPTAVETASARIPIEAPARPGPEMEPPRRPDPPAPPAVVLAALPRTLAEPAARSTTGETADPAPSDPSALARAERMPTPLAAAARPPPMPAVPEPVLSGPDPGVRLPARPDREALRPMAGPSMKLTSPLPELALGVQTVLDSPPASLSPYLLRDPEMRKRTIKDMGGSEETEKAIGLALDWFTRNQEEDGRWDIARHGGEGGHNVSATALALLCYMGWGATHMEPGPHQAVVSKGMQWLMAQVKPDGDVRGPGGTMYDHGIGAIALAEAYGLTRDPALRPLVEANVAFLKQHQNSQGGWRYNPGDANSDTSVVGWQVMALVSARMAGVEVPAEILDRVGGWFDRVGGGNHGGLYGYQDRSPRSPLVAQGLFSRQLLGVGRREPRNLESVDHLRNNLPSEKQPDMYLWYYGTLAMFQHQGPAWEEWNDRMKAILVGSQVTSGEHQGSWINGGQHQGRMGRAVNTALATLTLEVYFRYLPMYGREPVE